ncbi:hypothetical protein C5B90_19240 [Haloferax sp. Atlit-12N]|nr:hypothetical protein C5B90_19240 [Haloferax sp. Atlit-12N]
MGFSETHGVCLFLGERDTEWQQLELDDEEGITETYWERRMVLTLPEPMDSDEFQDFVKECGHIRNVIDQCLPKIDLIDGGEHE